MRFLALCLSVLLFLPLISSKVSAELPELLATIVCDTVNTFFGARIVAPGDINGDGYADILVFDYRYNYYLYFGGPDVDTARDLTFFQTVGPGDTIGDLNGDGINELVLTGRLPGMQRTNVYYTGTLLDTIRDMWFGVDTLSSYCPAIEGLDINANGTDEIITWATGNYSLTGYELGPVWDSVSDFRITPPNMNLPYAFGETMIGGDFNGDGKRDLAANFRASTCGSIYLYWGRAAFDTIPDMIIVRPGEYFYDCELFGKILVNLGDFNGDGYDDIFAAGIPSNDTTGFIYFGGPDIDDIPDIIIPRTCSRAHLAGDINGDGYNDLITSLSVSWSGMGEVKIYYGGPDADSIADISIYNWDMPEYQTYFGEDCAGLGDFNGDGINDFAFSAQPAIRYGCVYIFSGPKNGTGVEYDYEPMVPDDFRLGQNYPNPFNLETTIEFDIPRRVHVELQIYNLLGNKVRALISENLSSGRYRVRWDGRDVSGETVSSGIYFYELRTAEFTKSEKMVLLK